MKKRSFETTSTRGSIRIGVSPPRYSVGSAAAIERVVRSKIQQETLVAGCVFVAMPYRPSGVK